PSPCSKTSKWVNTMNTNEPKPATLGTAGSWATLLSETKNLPAGLPDPAILARIANEFFTVLPGSTGIPPTDLSQVSTAPTLSETGTEAQIGVLPTSLGAGSALGAGSTLGSPAPNTITPVPQAAMPAPAIPGGFAGADSSAAPIFSFLEEARPLFVEPAGYTP